ncbi:Haloacid dehalogenase-like hydrolase domain-containing protein [Camellia lanceoleosa]|uniref:Haloacid dehalogenase-like hydrolase domain-containing protein n=1 Tax=Camellia lanceoleosa TaxID=1840588 RepID=A0ACC0IQ68_9ERIC|nr:Haloacid dehalogenase-like hydrolase domain-containing protein [Camellia lanceoleosa]
MCSMKKAGLFTAICYVLEKHKLDVVSAHVSSDQNRTMYMIQAYCDWLCSGGVNSMCLMTKPVKISWLKSVSKVVPLTSAICLRGTVGHLRPCHETPPEDNADRAILVDTFQDWKIERYKEIIKSGTRNKKTEHQQLGALEVFFSLMTVLLYLRVPRRRWIADGVVCCVPQTVMP